MSGHILRHTHLVCPHCGGITEREQEIVPWMSKHLESRRHRWWWALKKRVGRFLCWLEFHKHPKSTAPAQWVCARLGCDKKFRQRWY